MRQSFLSLRLYTKVGPWSALIRLGEGAMTAEIRMKAIGFASVAICAFAASASAQQAQKPARDEIPAEQRAPKGMCRIWLKGVPAAQQPAPTDCAAAVKNC